jgi:hypothetical protein
MIVRTWREAFTEALRKNGESWADIEYTPFTDEQLGMSPDDSDEDLHFYGHDVAAYSEDWVYYVEFDENWEYASVHSLPRHPEVLIKREEVRHNIIDQAPTAMK